MTDLTPAQIRERKVLSRLAPQPAPVATPWAGRDKPQLRALSHIHLVADKLATARRDGDREALELWCAALLALAPQVVETLGVALPDMLADPEMVTLVEALEDANAHIGQLRSQIAVLEARTPAELAEVTS